MTMTKNTRTSVASTWRYSAMPPQIPPTMRFVVLRSRRVCMCTFPSLAKRVEDRDAERRDEAERDRWLTQGLRERKQDRRDGHRDVDDRRHRGVECRRRHCEDRRPDARGREAQERGTDERETHDPCRQRLTALREHREGCRVEARRALVGLELERASEDGLVEEVVAALAHAVTSSAVRRSARARRSCTPTVEDGRPTTAAISSTESSLK